MINSTPISNILLTRNTTCHLLRGLDDYYTYPTLASLIRSDSGPSPLSHDSFAILFLEIDVLIVALNIRFAGFVLASPVLPSHSVDTDNDEDLRDLLGFERFGNPCQTGYKESLFI